ncbi:MAG: hypothetical protein KME52_03650 [Desmonostoc geniculatum HA4340-LM1]|jgi:hypothetical protein|nr:hypothetical protein [Desmonostoc geniculatum HA4340-LM1]
MQNNWLKALATIPIALIISVPLAGCEPKAPYPETSTGGGTSAGGETSTGSNEQIEAARMEAALSELEQKLDLDISTMESAINLGNEQLARGLAPANCDTVLIFQTKLQEQVINGRLSASNSALVRIGEKLKRLRSLSQCAS